MIAEVGTTLTDAGGRIFLVFEPGRMVRVDEPLEILNFNPTEWPDGFCSIELPLETKRVIGGIYKAAPNIFSK